MLKYQPRLPCPGLCLSIVGQLYLRHEALAVTSSLLFDFASKSGREESSRRESRDWHLVPMAPRQLCTYCWQAEWWRPLPALELSKALGASRMIWRAGKNLGGPWSYFPTKAKPVLDHTRLLRALLSWVLESSARMKAALLSWAGILLGTWLREVFSTDAQWISPSFKAEKH